jgi:hypothetical protein
LFIVMDERPQRGGLLAIALRHAVVLGNRLLLNQRFESANFPGQLLVATPSLRISSLDRFT